MAHGGKRESSGRKGFKNWLRESDIPEMAIATLQTRLANDELSNSELISLLSYFQPRLSVQRVELDDKEETKQIDITSLWLNQLEENEDKDSKKLQG